MTQYLLSIYRDDKPRSEEEFQQSYEDVNALADELTAAGGLVFGGGLNHSTPTARSSRPTAPSPRRRSTSAGSGSSRWTTSTPPANGPPNSYGW
jgi:hypothetical protein